MKTNSSSKNNINKNEERIHRKLKGINFKKIAKQTGFVEREVKKISPKNFLIGFFLMVFSSGSNTLESWASKIGLLIGETVSKQAVDKRIKKDPTIFLRKILETVIKRNLNYKTDEVIKGFSNIFIHDSTSIKLNGSLCKYYPGNENMYPEIKKSVLKIQAIYNVVKRSFRNFEVTSFRDNDQSKSKDILQYAKKDDLVLRDQGYFSFDVFNSMITKGIYFISRLRFGVAVYENETLERIKLLKLLKNKSFLDQYVTIGRSNPIRVRLIALKLDHKTASERRRRAKLDRDRRLNHSKEYMNLLGWRILITNLDRERLSLNQIIDLYAIRFRIEVIFRCWKTYFKISNVQQINNKLRLQSYIYSMLIFIILFQTEFYRYVENTVTERREISVMKFSKFIANNLMLLLIAETLKECSFECILKQIDYYCCYQHRTDRLSFSDLLLKLG